MNPLPPESAYRLGLLLSSHRAALEDQMVQGAQVLSPHYAFMPAFLLHHWCHEVTGAVIAALIEADLRPLETYALTVMGFARRVGRSPDLVRGLAGVWCGLARDLVDAELAAEPEIRTETAAIVDTLLALADQVLTTVYEPDSAARELLHPNETA
jgi:hypothetical protein